MKLIALLLSLLLLLCPFPGHGGIGGPETPTITVTYQPDYQYKNLSTGIRISYVELGSKRGDPVVLLHGATDSYVSFSQVGTALANMGYHVYIPELRGHGNTSKPTGQAYTPGLLAKDIDAWMHQLGLTKAHVVGHSLGSFVAQELAISYKSRVSSLTLIGSAAKTTGNLALGWVLEGDDEFPGLIAFGDDIPDEFIVDWTASSNYDPAFVTATYKHAKSLPAYVWVNAFSALEVDNTARLSKIKVPVQIIWGENDDFFPIEDQNELQSALGSAAAEFIKIAGAGHNTHWEGDSAATIAAEIGRFID